MGMYLNPGNSGFEEIRNSRYVDKSGLISLVNRSVNAVVILSVSSTCCSFVKRYDVRITMVPKMSYDSEYSKVLSNLSLVEQFSILPDCLKKTFDFIKIHALIC